MAILKHKDVYLKDYADGRDARVGIAAWIVFCKDPRLRFSDCAAQLTLGGGAWRSRYFDPRGR